MFSLSNTHSDSPAHSPYGAALKALGFEMTLRGETVTASAAYDSLVTAINNVYDDIIVGTGYHGYEDLSGSGSIDATNHPMEHWMFDNRFRVIDGPWYASK